MSILQITPPAVKPSSDEPADFIEWLHDEWRRYLRLGTEAGTLAAKALELLADEAGFFASPGRPLNALDFQDRRDAHIRAKLLD